MFVCFFSHKITQKIEFIQILFSMPAIYFSLAANVAENVPMERQSFMCLSMYRTASWSINTKAGNNGF